MFQIKWLWKYMGDKRHLFVFAMIISAVTSSMIIINPYLSKILMDEVIILQNTEKLIPVLMTMLGIQAFRVGMRYLMIVFLEINSQTMLDSIRGKLYHVFQNQDHHFFNYMRTGDLMTRMTNDLDLVRHCAAWISMATVDSVFTFVSTFIFLMTLNWKLTLTLISITPVLIFLTRRISKKLRPLYINIREKLSELSTVTQENIAGNRVVRAFAREDYEKEKFEEKNAKFRDAHLKAAFTSASFQPISDFLAQSLTIITILMGGIFMMNGELTPGIFTVFMSLTWALSNPLRTLSILLNDFQRFFASCTMIIEVFYAKPIIRDKQHTKKSDERVKGDIRFENVNLTINNTAILKDISFEVKAGQKLGIMGTTGSGKTSLVNLLGRFFDRSSGSISLDNQDIQSYTLHDLRSSISYAMQDVFLFSDTVEGNIAYGAPDLPVEQVYACATAADADGFIRKMSQGYDTLIGERGVGLSGGQKQRLSLARAMAMRPSVLILDDTTSAVDMETEQYIQKQLRNLDFDCTMIMIAQRVSSIQDSDLILIMDEGEIVERGTHTELLANKGFYYSIWALQNDVEEGSDSIGS